MLSHVTLTESFRSSNLIFNEAGKLLVDVNGSELYTGPWGGSVPGYVNGHLAAFIDITDTHYKKLPSNCFEIVDYDWKSISNSYDNKFYKLGDNRFGFGGGRSFSGRRDYRR